MERLLTWLMAQPISCEPMVSLDAWWERHRALRASFDDPMALAIAGGFVADRLGYAFASGYQAAGVRLFGRGGREDRLTAFCATEKGSAHPSAITTRLERDGDDWRLTGEKGFVTFGAFAERLLVVASLGMGDNGRNRLRVVDMEARPGVVVTPRAVGAFVPEIPHATVTFDHALVKAEEVLEGDGYAAFLKPFRTVEDLHVHGALCGWLLQLSRACASSSIVEELLIVIVGLHGLASVSPLSAVGHLALGGAFAQVSSLLDRLEPMWNALPEMTRKRWERDRVLLNVAGKARVKRLEAARGALGQGLKPASSGA